MIIFKPLVEFNLWMHYLYTIIAMLQNKIYQNFIKEILKTFLIIVFGLSVIALTVRAVSFLDLMVENGYPVGIYFKYSLLNLFGIAPKFIPLAFLITIIIFILRHLEDSEFVILWTSGVKKIKLVNLFFISSISILIIYLLLSVFLTPLALNKSRNLLSQDHLNSFLPTIRSQQFSDSFKGFTFIVEKKINNEIKHIFLHDTGNNLKNLSSNISNVSSVTVLSEKGLVDERKLVLFNGQIISSKNNKDESEIIKFEQLNIDLSDLVTTTIKLPKLQEISTISLLNCFLDKRKKTEVCENDSSKEIIPILIRRLVLPFYIPVIALICSFLLLKREKFYLNKIFIFTFSFIILLLTELVIRYTGLNEILRWSYIISPFLMMSLLYFLLQYKFSSEAKT